MAWLKKPVVIKCYNKDELGRLLNWLRLDTGLSQLNRQRYEVVAVMAMQYWDNPDELLYFEVSVPYSLFKKMREDYFKQDAINDVLEQRAIAQILHRGSSQG